LQHRYFTNTFEHRQLRLTPAIACLFPGQRGVESNIDALPDH